jgi:hypothetical protein
MLLFWGCPSEKAQLKEFSFSMERTSCFGTCPQYKIYTDTDGKLYYEGIAHVDRLGRYTSENSKDLVREVYRKAVSVKYWEFEDTYNPGVVDLPATVTTLKLAAQTKTVENVMDAPPALIELENLIDSLAARITWQKLSY